MCLPTPTALVTSTHPSGLFRIFDGNSTALNPYPISKTLFEWSACGEDPVEMAFASLFIPRFSTPTRATCLCGPPVSRSRASPSCRLYTFDASDFEISRIIGQQSFATITDWVYYTPAPFAEKRTTEPSGPAIRLYGARIVAPLEEFYNARVLLKEFLPPAMEIAVAEAEAYDVIYASDPTVEPSSLPVATLLGSFLTDESFDTPSFIASWRSRFPQSTQPPSPNTPFLVFRFEGMKTAMSIATTASKEASQKEKTGNEWFDSLFPGNLFNRQSVYLRTFMKKCLLALQFLHSKSRLVHRSIGLASIMVNTVEWRYATNLDVKLRDFGFAKQTSALAQGKDLERARRAEALTPSQITAFYFAEDIYALGYSFTELVFSVFAEKPITQDTFKKLFEDTFNFNIEAIKDYCSQDPQWATTVRFLDSSDGAGWELMISMLRARQDYSSVSIEILLESSFLKSTY